MPKKKPAKKQPPKKKPAQRNQDVNQIAAGIVQRVTRKN
jgi:hypothetical protein